MSATTVHVIADSISAGGARITTLLCTFPRFILPEILTHRVFSRSTASSRAIPSKRILQNATAVPLEWGENCAGMSSRHLMHGWKLTAAKAVWGVHNSFSQLSCRLLAALGVHKQIANRLIEPHLMVSMLITSTDYTNFLDQRLGSEAQPEMRDLARAVDRALNQSSPEFLEFGQCHLPFVTAHEKYEHTIATCKLVSAARCARTSYSNYDGTKPDVEKDLRVAYKLLFPESGPMHQSPFEHIAQPNSHDRGEGSFNLIGWVSFRWELSLWWEDRLPEFWDNYKYEGTEQYLPC